MIRVYIEMLQAVGATILPDRRFMCMQMFPSRRWSSAPPRRRTKTGPLARSFFCHFVADGAEDGARELRWLGRRSFARGIRHRSIVSGRRAAARLRPSGVIMARRGHDVTIFTSENRWGAAADASIKLLPVHARTNHGADRAFARKFAAATAGKFDRVVGFNKLTGLDVLYCADPPVGSGRGTGGSARCRAIGRGCAWKAKAFVPMRRRTSSR